jgi:aminoglycoside 6'-N-acetyltransferase
MRDRSFQTLSSERLLMRRFEPSDAPALAGYRSDPEVARYQGWEACTLGDAESMIRTSSKRDPGSPGGWFQFAVALASNGVLIGDCALRCGRATPRVAELGFSFGRAHQGQGYASEAVALLLDYAFGRLGLHRVFAITDQRNLPARALLERVGFRKEGEFREASWFKGEWTTELGYAVLASEWRRDGA